MDARTRRFDSMLFEVFFHATVVDIDFTDWFSRICIYLTDNSKYPKIDLYEVACINPSLVRMDIVRTDKSTSYCRPAVFETSGASVTRVKGEYRVTVNPRTHAAIFLRQWGNRLH